MPGLPHDGWYNGSGDLMIKNGTYADFRDYFETHLKIVLGEAAAEEQLLKYDLQWEEMPLALRMERRKAVVDSSTSKWVEIAPGKRALKAHPSNNGILEVEFQQKAIAKETNRPAGSLSDANNPLLEEAQKAHEVDSFISSKK